jgi:hypothetical protein
VPRPRSALGALGAFYRAARKRFDDDPAFAERSRSRVVALQGGDPETLGCWRTLVALSVRAFQALYARLGVTLTEADVCGESFYNGRLGPLVAELIAAGGATESEGAIGVFPAGFTNEKGGPLPLIMRKRDGGYGYATTDRARRCLAAAPSSPRRRLSPAPPLPGAGVGPCPPAASTRRSPDCAAGSESTVSSFCDVILSRNNKAGSTIIHGASLCKVSQRCSAGA